MFGGRFEFPDTLLDEGDNVINVIATDDAGNASEPSDSIVVNFSPPAAPDLEVSGAAIRVLPNAPLVGDNAEVGVIVANVGNAPSPASDVSLVVVGPQGSSAVLLDRRFIPGLFPGQSIVVTAPWQVGAAPGIYRIVVSVDDDEMVVERSEANNFGLREIVVAGDEAPVASIALDGVSFEADAQVGIEAVLTNFGQSFSGARFDRHRGCGGL